MDNTTTAEIAAEIERARTHLLDLTLRNPLLKGVLPCV